MCQFNTPVQKMSGDICEGSFTMTAGVLLKRAVIRRVKMVAAGLNLKCDIEDLGGWPEASLIVRVSGKSESVLELINRVESLVAQNQEVKA